MRIPWRPKVPGPNLQHRNMTSYVGDSSKQSVRVNMHSMKMKHSLKGGDRPSASHTDGHETTSTMDTLRLGTNEVPTHDGSFDHTPDNDSWQDVSSKSSSLGADEPREVLRQHDDVDNRPYPPDFGNQDGRSSRRNSEVNRVYTSLSTSFTNNKDPGQSRPSDASINRAPLDSGSNSGDLSSRGGKKDESVEQFNPESLDQTITSVAEKAGKKSKKTKKTLVHGKLGCTSEHPIGCLTQYCRK